MTAMMEQYLSIKNAYQDHILFYRLGDFYEMFFEDAQTASKVLGLTLTGRDCGEPERAPMCGVPYHSAEGYIGELIKNGYKVAICEQMEEPGASFAGIGAEEDLLSELATIGPIEIITNADLAKQAVLQAFVQERGILCTGKLKSYFEESTAAQWFCEIAGAYGQGQESFLPAMYACGAAFGYFADMQKSDLSHFDNIAFYENTQYLEMDTSTRRNLELMETMLDKENTSMGRRLLRSFLEHPLRDVKKIVSRQRSVAELVSNHMLREEIRHLLTSVLDMERILTRILYGTGSARELRALAQSIEVLPQIKTLLQAAESVQLSAIWERRLYQKA